MNPTRASRDGEAGPGYRFMRPLKRGPRGNYVPADADVLDITAWTSAAAKALRSSKVRRVRVLEWDQPTLAPLAKIGEHVEHLYVGSGPWFPKKLDLTAVSRMPYLTKLSLTGPIDGIDFSALTRLTGAHFELADTQGLGNLEAAPALTHLSIGGGRGIRDLVPLASFPRLARLTLAEIRLTSLRGGDRCRHLRELVLREVPVQGLDGLEGAPRLESLFCLYLRKFRSLEGIGALPAMRKLELHTCRKVVPDLHRIGEARRLEHLVLESMGTIPSLDIVAGLRNLRFIQMAEGTKIADGDLSVLLKLPKLEECLISNRKHYVPPAPEIETLVAERARRRRRRAKAR